MIELLRPWVIILLPLPLIAWWLLPALPVRAALSVPAGIHALLLALSNAQTQRRNRWSVTTWLRLLGWLALIVAFSGPQTREEALLKPTGRDLMVAVDLSDSMGQKCIPRGIMHRQLLCSHHFFQNRLSARRRSDEKQ